MSPLRNTTYGAEMAGMLGLDGDFMSLKKNQEAGSEEVLVNEVNVCKTASLRLMR